MWITLSDRSAKQSSSSCAVLLLILLPALWVVLLCCIMVTLQIPSGTHTSLKYGSYLSLEGHSKEEFGLAKAKGCGIRAYHPLSIFFSELILFLLCPPILPPPPPIQPNPSHGLLRACRNNRPSSKAGQLTSLQLLSASLPPHSNTNGRSCDLRRRRSILRAKGHPRPPTAQRPFPCHTRVFTR